MFKNKRFKLVLCVVIVIVTLFSLATTGLATGSTLTHSGTGSYYTSDYVSQWHDNNLRCTKVQMCTGFTLVQPYYNHPSYGKVYLGAYMKQFQTGCAFYIDDYTQVRHVHLDVETSTSSIMTYGFWYLYQ